MEHEKPLDVFFNFCLKNLELKQNIKKIPNYCLQFTFFHDFQTPF